MDDLELLFNSKITLETLSIKEYIERTWKFFYVKVERPLRELFPEPENKGLKHIWKYGSADLIIYRNNKIICIIEPGGSHHWEEKQQLNDRRKWKLCEINGVRCLRMMNGLQDQLSKKKWRNLLGSFLFENKQDEEEKIDEELN
jgi:hypothetical protein